MTSDISEVLVLSIIAMPVP